MMTTLPIALLISSIARWLMRIFVHHDASPEQTVRQALDTLIAAGIYSVEGGGTINDRALILVDAAHVPEAIAALSKAGMRAATG
jgi:hypothetical protein